MLFYLFTALISFTRLLLLDAVIQILCCGTESCSGRCNSFRFNLKLYSALGTRFLSACHPFKQSHTHTISFRRPNSSWEYRCVLSVFFDVLPHSRLIPRVLAHSHFLCGNGLKDYKEYHCIASEPRVQSIPYHGHEPIY